MVEKGGGGLRGGNGVVPVSDERDVSISAGGVGVEAGLSRRLKPACKLKLAPPKPPHSLCDTMKLMLFDASDPSIFDVQSRAAGPAGALPLTTEMLREKPSGDLFGWTQDAGMGWDASKLGAREFLILSTHGGIRAADGGEPVDVLVAHYEARLTAGFERHLAQ